MACARRDGEADGEPDRSLRHMLRAIAEERSRAGLRHDGLGGLGESGGAGGNGAGPGAPIAPAASAPGRHRARFNNNNHSSSSTCCVPRARPLLPARAPGIIPAPLSEMPLEEKTLRQHRAHHPILYFLSVNSVPCVFGVETSDFGRLLAVLAVVRLSRDCEADASLLCLNDFTLLAVV